MKKQINWIDEDVLEALKRYDWPGNVRELENLVDFLAATCQGEVIDKDLLANTPLADFSRSSSFVPLKDARFEFTKKYLEDLLRFTKGNISAAAKLAGYYRADLYKLIEKHGLEPAEFRKKGRKISTAELRKL